MNSLLKSLAALAAAAVMQTASAAEPLKVLFVGNSFTYTRPPALQYNIDNVVDLNAQNAIDKPEGNDPLLPQPWGGVPGIVKMLADQAGVPLDIQHSLRGGATLRGHLLNTNPAGWDLRANIASARWDAVVLQGNSTEAVDRAGGDFAQFSTYVGLLERFIHVGDAHSYRESNLYPGGSTTLRRIPANPHANPAARILLYQTWARPDLTYPTGAPYFGEPLETMTQDLRNAYAAAATSNTGISGVVPVGEAYMLAVQLGAAIRNPYAPVGHGVDLWWPADRFHPSGHGAYLSGLMMFGALTGVDPASFGATERAASDLGIRAKDAMALQKVASEKLRASGHDVQRWPCLRANPDARGNICKVQ